MKPLPLHPRRSLANIWLVGAALFVISLHCVRAEVGPVRAVQDALKKNQFYFGETTGNLDEATLAALRRFQIRSGLPATGEIDSATLQALEAEPVRPAQVAPPQTPNAPKSSSTQSDREFLKKVEKDDIVAAPVAIVSPTEANPTMPVEKRTDPAPIIDPTALLDREKPAAPVGDTAPSASPEKVSTTTTDGAISTKVAAEERPIPSTKITEQKQLAKPTASVSARSIESGRPKVVVQEKRSAPARVPAAPELEIDATRERVVPATRREIVSRPAPLPVDEVAVDPAAKAKVTVTTVTTRRVGPDGRIYTDEKKTTTLTRPPNSGAPSVEQPAKAAR